MFNEIYFFKRKELANEGKQQIPKFGKSDMIRNLEIEVLQEFSIVEKKRFLKFLNYLYQNNTALIEERLNTFLNKNKFIEEYKLTNMEGSFDCYCIKNFINFSPPYCLANNFLVRRGFDVFTQILTSTSLSSVNKVNSRGDWVEFLMNTPSSEGNFLIAYNKYQKIKRENNFIRNDSSLNADFLKSNIADILVISDDKFVAIKDISMNLSSNSYEYLLYNLAYAFKYDEVILAVNDYELADKNTKEEFKRKLKLAINSFKQIVELYEDDEELNSPNYDENNIYSVVKNKQSILESIYSFKLDYEDSQGNSKRVTIKDFLSF